MNGNSDYITTSFIPCNTDSYYIVITITKRNKIKGNDISTSIVVISAITLAKMNYKYLIE